MAPEGVPGGWERTDLWKTAAAIPSVRVVRDAGGAEAVRFGALTSGECVLFAADGRRLFHGGITAARGHEGDNAGQDRLMDLLRAGTAAVEMPSVSGAASTPVYGCPLRDAAVPTSEASGQAPGGGGRP
jgi:hypothetical protein